MKINFYKLILNVKWIILIPLTFFSIFGQAQDPIAGYTYLGLSDAKHFYLSTTASTWDNAEIAATNLGATLATLDSDESHLAMVNWLQAQAVSFAWIGGHATPGTENFYWQSGAPWAYTQWYPGEPNNLGEECALIQYSTSAWKDCPCYLSIAYVIEFPAAIEPEIDVIGNGLSVVDGDNSPSISDDTDFGIVAINSSKTHTFTIDNSQGTGELILNSISITGNGSSNFTLGATPSTIPAGQSAPLEVIFTPQGIGTFEVKINMSNNDLDEHPYNFNLRGQAVIAGEALAFDGTDDVVQTAGFGFATNDFTVEAWVNTNFENKSQYIVSNRTTEATSAGNWFALGISDEDFPDASWKFSFVTGLAGTSSQLKMKSCSDVPAGWNHIAVTRKGTTYSLYVNGLREEQVTHPAINLSGTFNFSNIGGCKFQDNNYFDGEIDEVRIWTKALSNDEIRNNLNTAQACNGLVGLKEYYQFNQGYAEGDNPAENILFDCAGAINNGTLYNFDLGNNNSNSNWVSSGSMAITLPEIPIATAAFDVCHSSDPVVISGGEGWVDIYTQDCGQLIGSINAPEGLDLGIISADLIVNSEVAVIGNQSGDAIKLLPRAVNISSSNYPNSALLPQNVQFRFFFLETELQDLNNTAAGSSGVTNYAAGELSFTHYSGPNQDCDLSNNTMLPEFVEILSNNIYGPHGSDHYLQFSLSHFSELVAHEPTLDALPVELTYFGGEIINHNSVLRWKTSLEENMKGFEIQQSTDNEEWSRVGFVDAKGMAHSYEYTDDTPRAGNNYYRLKITDLDNSFEYSDIIVLSYNRNTSFLAYAPYPNPTNGSNLNMKVYSEFKQNAVINIHNNMGQLITSTNVDLNSGNNNLNIDVASLSSGMYQLELLIDETFASRHTIMISNK